MAGSVSRKYQSSRTTADGAGGAAADASNT